MLRPTCLVLALLSASLLVLAHNHPKAPAPTSTSTSTQKPNACDYTKCGYGASCVPTDDGRATCVCPSVCPQYIKPICGSDGKTYGNPCFMKVSACKDKKDVRQVSDQACPATTTKRPANCQKKIAA